MAKKNELRVKVDAQIKKVIVPELRKQNFRGSFPHFRRIYEDGRVDYLSFEFALLTGGSFMVELAVAYPYKGKEGNFYYWDEVTPEFIKKKSNYAYTSTRLRIEPSYSQWVAYTNENYEDIVNQAKDMILENMSYFDEEAKKYG